MLEVHACQKQLLYNQTHVILVSDVDTCTIHVLYISDSVSLIKYLKFNLNWHGKKHCQVSMQCTQDPNGADRWYEGSLTNKRQFQI